MTDEKNSNYKKSPKTVKLHYDQMKNTIDLLEDSGFAKEKIYPVIDIESDIKSKEIMYNVCWSKKVSGVNESNFLSIDSYEKIIEAKSFQMLLFDNSVIRCSLIFNGRGKLLKQNFSYVPCPLNKLYKEYEGEALNELLNDISIGIYEKDKLLMRTAIRLDFDLENDTELHPASHMHLQNSNTRLSVSGPICFNSFVKHIIETYYPRAYYVKNKILSDSLYKSINLDNWEGLIIDNNTNQKIKYKNQSKITIPQIKY